MYQFYVIKCADSIRESLIPTSSNFLSLSLEVCSGTGPSSSVLSYMASWPRASCGSSGEDSFLSLLSSGTPHPAGCTPTSLAAPQSLWMAPPPLSDQKTVTSAAFSILYVITFRHHLDTANSQNPYLHLPISPLRCRLVYPTSHLNL